MMIDIWSHGRPKLASLQTSVGCDRRACSVLSFRPILNRAEITVNANLIVIYVARTRGDKRDPAMLPCPQIPSSAAAFSRKISPERM